jgi:hypothetical protein
MKRSVIRALVGATKWRIPFFIGVCCLLSISRATLTYGSGCTLSSSKAQPRDLPAENSGSQFAIADFDGDQRPDVATLQMVRLNSLDSDYRLSFRLSRGGLQTIGVTGPSGGLALLGRDVNGDCALDLVLVSAWQHRLIAVLLNDGAGNFAAAPPAQFQINIISSTTQAGTAPGRIDDRTILAVQYSVAGGLDRDTWAEPDEEAPLGFSRSFELARTLSQSSILGRAPPASIPNRA